MKKGIQITTLMIVSFFLLTGTALARSTENVMACWETLASAQFNEQEYIVMPVRAEVSHLRDNKSLFSAGSFACIQQAISFAGCQGNITVDLPSMLSPVRSGGLTPAIALEFVW